MNWALYITWCYRVRADSVCTADGRPSSILAMLLRRGVVTIIASDRKPRCDSNVQRNVVWFRSMVSKIRVYFCASRNCVESQLSRRITIRLNRSISSIILSAKL